MSNFTLGILLFCVAGREAFSAGWMVFKSVRALATAQAPVPDGKAEDFAAKLTATLVLAAAVAVFCTLAGLRLI